MIGVRLPLAKPASIDLVFKDACSFGSMTGGTRWGGTLGLYSTVRLWLLDFGGVITALWPMSEQLSSSASSTGEGGNGGNSITSTLTCRDTIAIRTKTGTNISKTDHRYLIVCRISKIKQGIKRLMSFSQIWCNNIWIEIFSDWRKKRLKILSGRIIGEMFNFYKFF